jgi:hypothetical protein
MRHLNEAGLTLVFKRLVDLHPHIPSSPHFFIYTYIIGGVVWQTGSEREANAFGARGILVSESHTCERHTCRDRSERNTCYTCYTRREFAARGILVSERHTCRDRSERNTCYTCYTRRELLFFFFWTLCGYMQAY